ncbi:aldehyde dehydrogenase [Caballeronia sp. GaOx3]|uniref:aldehyde dehydrogenase n=1 Tax=Caballeronia sp. GaOx3 TaxID=2921740 RepID=UPI0020285C4C|nr:aldehyde dehydrogenase [Caballeronia sp. GaOx3]
MASKISSFQHYIRGTFQEADSFIDIVNPATEEVIGRGPVGSGDVVDKAVAAARAAQPQWAARPAIERAGYLRKITEKIRANVDRLARIVSEEQGKTLSLAKLEVAFAADYIDYMAEWARRIEGEIVSSDRAGEQIFVFRKPLGVVAGILPWNFPFFMIARKMAPALITGNTIVIKPSEETPINCFEFVRLVAETDLPPGVFNVVGGGRDTGAALASHSDVDFISFTGSGPTGSSIMTAAAANVTKVNLELGGKAPCIVLADADLELAVSAIRGTRILNSGQACSSAERVYVQRSVAAEFTDKITSAISATRLGNPLTDTDIDMGPLTNRAGLLKVDAMVQAAIKDGATVRTGGAQRSDGRGFFYAPTVLADCKSDMSIMRDETFGPVLPIQIVEDLEEAITLANDTNYGLTSSVYTRDLSSAMKACRELQFGETYINREHFEAMQGFHAGIRKSGIGGADGKHGLYEYMYTHTVYVQA